MSDFLIIRIPFDEPNKPEIIEFLANVPINWQKYLKKVAKKAKREGRYLVASLNYDLEYFLPKRKEKVFEKIERKTEGNP